MITLMTAVARQSVQKVSKTAGWRITSRMLTAPSGPTAMPKRTTIQGMVFHRFIDGQVAGSWRYEDGEIRLDPFAPLTAADRHAVEDEAHGLALLHAE